MSLQDRLSDILGFENGTPDIVHVEVTPEEHAVVAVDGEIAAADAVVAEHEQEIIQVQADMDSLEERVEDLEENVEGLESLLNGSVPWNPELAQKYYSDARKIYQRSFKVTPSALEDLKGAESFSDASTAEMELAAGLEKIREGAANLIEGAKKFFIHLFKVVTAFFVGIFNKLAGLERKADILVSRINSVGDDKIKETIKLGGWNAYLGVEKSSKFESKAPALAVAVAALSNQTESGLADGIKRGCAGFISGTSGKIAGVEITVSTPSSATVAEFNGAKFNFKVSPGDIKTSGEFKSGKSKSTLVEMAKRTKSEAAATRAQKLSASDMNSARDKAIKAATKSGETDKDTAATIKAGNKAVLRITSNMIKYQTNLIAAQQSFIAAHV